MKITVNFKLYLMLLAFIGLVFLLFFVESHSFSSRSWQHAWNLGHVFLFIFIGYIVFHYFPDIHNKKLGMQFLFLTSLALLLGLGVEVLQTFVSRQASLQDVMLDVVGAIVSVALFSRQFRILRLYKMALLVLLLISLIFLSSWKLMTSLSDEYQARRDFPILADFEHAWEIERWTSIEKMLISEEVSIMGLKSLKVILTPRVYSGVELKYFPGDWSRYGYLLLQVFNPEADSMFITVSIFDNKHKVNRFDFTDRYTKRFQLQHGWNEITVSLDEVKRAPKKRDMDIANINGLRLFVVRPSKMKHIYIDDVRLKN